LPGFNKQILGDQDLCSFQLVGKRKETHDADLQMAVKMEEDKQDTLTDFAAQGKAIIK
jgi:hypothetical protein